MAKKKKLKKVVSDKNNSQKKEDGFLEEKELEQIEDYTPLNISLKNQILIGLGLFIFFSICYFAFIKIVQHNADKKIESAKIYYEIADKFNSVDTETLMLFQKTEKYKKINDFQKNIGKNLTSMFHIIKLKYIPDTYVTEFQITKDLSNDVIEIIKEKSAEFKEIDNIDKLVSIIINDIKSLQSQIDRTLKTNKEIVEDGDYDDYIDDLQNVIFDLKSLCFAVEDHIIRIRGLWNKAAAIDASIELLQKAVSIDNESAEGYYYLGKTYELMGQTELAGERYAMVFKFKPDSLMAKTLLEKFEKEIDNSEKKLKELTESEDILEKPEILKQNAGLTEKYMQNLYNLSLSYFRMGKEKQAENIFNKIVQIDKKTGLNSYLGFIADKRIQEINNKTPEVIYDPRF